MKKFLQKVSIFVAYILALSIILPVWIDPFNVLHVHNIRVNGLEPNQHYIKVEYILNNPNKFDSFMFGSSRVGAIHTDKIYREKCYNMTYSAGIPKAHLENITTFFAHNIHPKRIYMGIDSFSYTTDYKQHAYEPIRCPWKVLNDSWIYFAYLYIDPALAFQSLRKMNASGVKKDIFYEYGWRIPYDANRKTDWTDARILVPSYGKICDIQSTLGVLRKIVNICYEHDTELIIFTNPMHYITYTASVNEKQYFDFLESLAEISDFWNFSSLNNITLSNDCYLETSHYKAKVGDLIIDIMCNGKSYPELQAQGFGVKVTRENVKDFINFLKQQAEDYRHNNSPAI